MNSKMCQPPVLQGQLANLLACTSVTEIWEVGTDPMKPLNLCCNSWHVLFIMGLTYSDLKEVKTLALRASLCHIGLFYF